MQLKNKRSWIHDLKTILATLILLCSISNGLAYDSEGGLAEGETYNIEYNEGYNYYEHKNPNNPSWYDPIIKLILKFVALFQTDEDVTVTHNVSKESWNGASYEPTGDESGFSWDLSFDKNQTTSVITTIDPVKEFFKDDIERFDGFDTNNEHPDILNVSTTIDGAGTELDKTDYGYTTVSEECINELEKEIIREIDGQYGFDIDSIAGEGGSGGLHKAIGWGDMDSTSREHKNIFEVFFFTLIPIIFILLIFTVIKKIL